MTNKILLGSVWAATLAVSFLLGGVFLQDSPSGSANIYLQEKAASQKPSVGSSRKPSLPQTKVSSGITFEKASGGASSEFSAVRSDGDVSEEVSSRNSEQDSHELLLRNLRSGNPVERLSAFTSLLKNPTSANLKAAIDAYEALPGGYGRTSELKMLTYAWAQVDPAGALAWMKEQGGFERRVGFGTILNSWAEKDAESAIAWARENHEGEDNPYYIGIVNGMADTNPEGATELMMTLPYGRIRGQAASMLIEKQWNKGEDVARRWADSLDQGSIKDYVVGKIVGKIAREDLTRAATWASEMPEGGERTRAVETVADRWAEKDPAAAANWVDGLPGGESRSEGMQEVVREWARKDPAAAAEWLNKYPAGPEMDKPVEALVRTVATKDPQNALTWAESITDEKRREDVVRDVNRIIERQEGGGDAPRAGDGRGRRGPFGPPPR